MSVIMTEAGLELEAKFPRAEFIHVYDDHQRIIHMVTPIDILDENAPNGKAFNTKNFDFTVEDTCVKIRSTPEGYKVDIALLL